MKHQAWITKNWEKEGMTWVVVAREREGDEITLGAFLIDGWCLGVKNAWGEDLPSDELSDLLDQQIPEEMRESIDPACAKNFIEGAVVYAQALGFLPHRDFRRARKALSGLDAKACTRAFTYGRDGRPFFVVGPDDDEARIRRVTTVLAAKFGAEGFGFLSPLDEEEPTEPLFVFLESEQCPDQTLSGFIAEGFVAAFVCASPERSPAPVWPMLFGGLEPVLANADDAEAIGEGWRYLWDETVDALEAGTYLPFFPDFDHPDHREVAAEFCRGFLRGWALLPTTGAGAQEVVEAQLAVVRRILEPVSDEAVGRRDLAPVIAAAIRAIYAATMSLRPDRPL